MKQVIHGTFLSQIFPIGQHQNGQSLCRWFHRKIFFSNLWRETVQKVLETYQVYVPSRQYPDREKSPSGELVKVRKNLICKSFRSKSRSRFPWSKEQFLRKWNKDLDCCRGISYSYDIKREPLDLSPISNSHPWKISTLLSM